MSITGVKQAPGQSLSDTQAIASVMRVRAQQLGLRLLLPVVLAPVFQAFTGWPVALGWLFIYAALQGVEAWLFRPSTIDAWFERRGGRALALGLVFLNCVVYGAIAPALALRGDSWGVVCGAVMLGASMMNSVLTSATSPLVFRTAIIPPVAYLLMLPILAAARGASPAEAISVGVAAGVNVLAALVSWRTLQRILRAEHAARAALEAVTAEHDQTIARLRRSEERLKIAVGNANLYIYEVDLTGQEMIKVGDELEYFPAPLSYADYVSRGLANIHPEDRAAAAEAWERRLQTGEASGALEFRINRDDKLVWVQSSLAVFTDENNAPTGMIGAFQNITARKLSEQSLREAKDEAEAANVAKSAFLATMSHEIRTPLNGVLGMAQAMAADGLSDMQRNRLDVIRQSGESLLAILNDMLDISKIEAGKVELEEIEFDLDEIARGAHATFTALANKKGLSFNLDVSVARGLYLGDPTRIRQVLYNLISNALKFTESGEIRVHAVHDGHALTLSVSDTGIGMSPAARESLFVKFSQADASTTRRFGGTGLGLAICKQLAELMGGEICVTSAEGEGSTFVFRIPLARVGEARASSPMAGPAAEIPTMALRVLSAEDNTVNQLVLKTLLHQVGVDPVMVGDGRAALEAWETGEWDAILMDVQMPVMDGPAATRAIREREAATGRPRTPIIALTANAMSHQIAAYLAGGMDGYVTKPIEAAKLFEALEQVLDAKEAARDEAAA